MILDFQQGIITYPSSGSIQRFLVYGSNSVSISTADGRIDVAFAHGDKNYLFTEASNVQNAWVGINPSSDAWLYWDLDTLTAARTYGITYVAPLYGSVKPTSPVSDQHWFDTVNMKMWRFHSGKWLNCIRVFACKINNNVFTPMGSNPGKPYAGTQVGLSSSSIPHGRILADSTGTPIRRADGVFLTSEDEMFVNGSPVNTIRLEANILNGTATESIARYQVVRFSDFGKVSLAQYNHIQTTAIAMSMEDLNQGQTGTLCMQGVVTNPEWNWTKVGAPLWAHGSIPGLLVEHDPHENDAGTYKIGKTPIARVLTPTSIFFDQGLGAKGDKGDQGAANVPLATDTVFGISKLSLAAADVTNPIVVGDNDPRNFNDRYPLPHNQPASTITATPVGILNGITVQDDLQIINNSFVKKAGDTMTGHLVLSADPATPLHAATKQYVDNMTLNGLSDVVLTNPLQDQVLKFDGTNWVNGLAEGGSLWQYAVEETARGADQYALEPKTIDAKTSTPVDQLYVPLHTEVESDAITSVNNYWFNESAVAVNSQEFQLTANGVDVVTITSTPDGEVDLIYTVSCNEAYAVVETRIPYGERSSQLGGPTGWNHRVTLYPFDPNNIPGLYGASIAVDPDRNRVFVMTTAYQGYDNDTDNTALTSVTALTLDLKQTLWQRNIRVDNTEYYDTPGCQPNTTGIAINPGTGDVAVTIPVFVDTVDYAAVREWGTSVVCFSNMGATLWTASHFGKRQQTYSDSTEQGLFWPDIVFGQVNNGESELPGFFVSAGDVIVSLRADTGVGMSRMMVDDFCNVSGQSSISGLAFDPIDKRLYMAVSGMEANTDNAFNYVARLPNTLDSVHWAKKIAKPNVIYDDNLMAPFTSPTRIAWDGTGVITISSLEYHGVSSYDNTPAGDLTIIKMSDTGEVVWANDIEVLQNGFANNSSNPAGDRRLTTQYYGSYAHVVTHKNNLFFTAPFVCKYGVLP